MYRDRIRDKIKALGVQDLDLWPDLDPNLLPKGLKKETFEKRKNAVVEYLLGTSFMAVVRRNGWPNQFFSKLMYRCLEIHSDGRIWGFRACKYYKHVKEYERLADAVPNFEGHHGGYSGAMNQFLESNDDIKDDTINYFLGKNTDSFIGEPKVSHKETWKHFKKLCRAKGITEAQYPFCVQSEGRWALRKYLMGLIVNYYSYALARFGEDVAKSLRVNSLRKRTIPVVLPYQRVEIDGHHVDASFEITITLPNGDTEVKQLSRFWILVAREVLTGAVLGYSISLKRNYNSRDVRKCIINSLTKWEQRKLSIPELSYTEDGGFPLNRFDCLKGVVPSEVALDNAKAHLAESTIELLVDRLAIALNFGPVATPDRRAFIERLFKYLEENGFHRIPSTHGTKPSDSRRTDPKKMAAKYHITLTQLEDIVAVMLWDFNGLPSKHGFGKSPLQTLEFWLSKKLVLPRLSPAQQRTLVMYDIEVVATIRGGMKGKRAPYVEYDGAEYTSDRLMASHYLVGKKVKLCINSEDGGSCHAYLCEDGTDLDILVAKGRWGKWPHSIEDRKQIIELERKRLLVLDDYDSPVNALLDYLHKKGDVRKQAEVERHQKEVTSNNTEPSAQPPTPMEKDASSPPPPNPEAYKQTALIRKKENAS